MIASRAMSFLQHHAAKGQIVTGLLYVESESEDLHGHLDTVAAPLNKLSEKELCPGSAALEKINASLRYSEALYARMERSDNPGASAKPVPDYAALHAGYIDITSHTYACRCWPRCRARRTAPADARSARRDPGTSPACYAASSVRSSRSAGWSAPGYWRSRDAASGYERWAEGSTACAAAASAAPIPKSRAKPIAHACGSGPSAAHARATSCAGSRCAAPPPAGGSRCRGSGVMIE